MPPRSLALGGLLVVACLLPPPAAAHASVDASAQVQDREPRPSGLPQPPSPRREGLPTVLALVALLGVASMQVRVLLAEPDHEDPDHEDPDHEDPDHEDDWPEDEPGLTPPSAPT